MALIAMCCYDTVENNRTAYTVETINSLIETVDLNRHRIFIIDNDSCIDTKNFLSGLQDNRINVITLESNLGTAKGINKAWAYRKDKEHLIKMDNDVVIYSYGWVEELEEAIERDNKIGIIGLKRKDLLEDPNRNDNYKSSLRMLKHNPGQTWITVEDVDHVMGTCQMYNYRLINKIGGMIQPSIYGFDDSISAIRCKLAGFGNCFLPHIEIDHIDNGENPYTQIKRDIAQQDMGSFYKMKQEYIDGTKSIYVKI